MKKISLIAIAAIAVSFASCSKARTCTCTISSTHVSTTKNAAGTVVGTPVTDNSSYTMAYALTKAKKKEARPSCLDRVETHSTTNPTFPTGYTDNDDYTDTYSSCTLK